MSQVLVQDVRKAYGQVQVIHGVNINIADGEFVVLVGPSGCGKSTLLRMIAGLESITGGKISIGDRVVNNVPPSDRDIAMVFQSYALYPHMKVRDNMAFSLKLKKTSPQVIEERVKSAAGILGLTPYLDRYPRQLSGGQRQRVAMGRAIVRQPKAFLFDEPLSNLDARLREQMRAEIKKLHGDLKATSIYVTHDQIEAMTLADRIVVMNNRRIEQIGMPMEIYERPATRFVAGFVGSPQMNFIPAKLSGNDGSDVVATLGDGTPIQTTIGWGVLPAGNYTLGIRAEAICVAPAGQGQTDGTVDVLERLGERTLVYTRLKDGQVVVANDTGNSRIRVGDAIALTFDGAKAHLFDAAGRAWHGREVGDGE